MATEESCVPGPEGLEINSYETALCIIPPPELCHDIERLRALYDKGYGKWPPHINFVYPFVVPENLPRTKELIQKKIQAMRSSPCFHPPTVKLDSCGYFEHKHNRTIYVCESEKQEQTALVQLRRVLLEALGQHAKPAQLHLTIGQSEDKTESAQEFLLDKASLLPEISFPLERLAILIRERRPDQPKEFKMRLWDTTDINLNFALSMSEFWLKELPDSLDEADNLALVDDTGETETTVHKTRVAQPETTYQFDPGSETWASMRPHSPKGPNPASLKIASYNVLRHSGYLPSPDRDPLLLDAILSPFGTADILVLQEVSDDFLSYLLADAEVRRRYPFSSNGPPSQPDLGPLPNLRNVSILSRWPFTWASLPFQRRHKGAVIAQFNSVRKPDSSKFLPLVVAGVHLTCGLTDGSVAAKSVQLQNLKNYLVREFLSNPWVIAGDFNIATSTHTIQTAVKDRLISPQTVETLLRVEEMITGAGLIDTWSVIRPEEIDRARRQSMHDAVYVGESGATFSPTHNDLAAATSGTSNNRPQRYDRILVKPERFIGVQNFNMFGLPDFKSGDVTQLASDHWGVRAVLNIYKDEEVNLFEDYSLNIQQTPCDLSDEAALRSSLSNHRMFPLEAEVKMRAKAFSLVKMVLLGSSDKDTISSDIPIIIVPVGSYALNVWTSSSDIDCLCIGSISSKTFFTLARQRIFKHSNRGIRLLRKVEANTGTMFELSVNGVRMDLQYCPAARIVERWSTLSNLSDSDPIYNLPMLSLRKLKPFRDIRYVQNTVPNIEGFRLAYRCIKLWAMQRGLYSSKFGYLGGIHITLMLSWICKRMAHQVGSVTAIDIVITFFHHYSNFNWKDDMVFDAFFHKKRPRYQRSAREPMVILGFHAPNTNIAHTSSTPALNTLVKEFRLASEKLAASGMTWEEFFGTPGDPPGRGLTVGARDFLTAHDSYVKIDLQYWGRSLNKATSFLGWLESRSLFLVADIHKAVPSLDIRLFPARFAESETIYVHADYNGCYLLGLSKGEGMESVPSKEDRQAIRAKLTTTMDRFVNQVHLDGKNYDPSTSWIEVSIVSRSVIKDMVLDGRDWGEYAMEADEYSDDEGPDDDDGGDEDHDQLLPSAVEKLTVRPSGATSQPVSANKLRPASDVLNRLRWDPNLDLNDYIVGYEDRFTGAKEMSLGKWKTEQTDEEFIPQHRILHFKRRSDGKIVWERKRRLDLMFGSGAGEGG